MFRQPGVSRQPTGILASSPQLANVVRRRMNQPVQMAHGGYHPPGDPMGSADANERAFRIGATRGLIPDALSAFAAKGPGISRRLQSVLSKYPKSGFAGPLLQKIMSMSAADQNALADQIEASEVETISRGKDPSMAQGIETLKEVGDVLTSDITPLSDLERKLNPNLRVDIGVGDQGGVRPPIGIGGGQGGGEKIGEREIYQRSLRPAATDPSTLLPQIQKGAGETLATDDPIILPKSTPVDDDSDGPLLPKPNPDRGPLSKTDIGAAGLGVEPSKETNVVSVEKLEALQDESLMGTEKDAQFMGEINDVLNSDLSNQEKNDGILEITGAKDPNKKLTTEERVKANIELYEKYLGVDASDKYDMNDAAIDFGIALASGDSPDLRTNVVKAAAKTLGNFKEDRKSRKARKDKLKMLGLTKAFDDEKEERQWSRELAKIDRSEKYDWKKTLFKNQKDADRFDAKMAFDKTALISKLNAQIEIANANADNAAIRDKANNEAALLRAKIGALPDGHAAAYLEFEGKDFTDPEVAADFHKRADEIAENLAKNKATSQTRKAYGVGEIEVLIANAVQDQVKARVQAGLTPTDADIQEITKQVRAGYSTALAEAQKSNLSTTGGFQVTREGQEGQ